MKCHGVIDPQKEPYEVHYDHLVIGVGAQPNSFHTPGVEEHAFYLKVSHSFVLLFTIQHLPFYDYLQMITQSTYFAAGNKNRCSF